MTPSKSSALPRELLHIIFTFTEPFRYATCLGQVCRDWRNVYEELLYSSIAIFDKETVKKTERGCSKHIVHYYLKQEDQTHGVYIEKKGEGKSWKQLNLLCRTLSKNNNRLASYVREVDFCTKIFNFPSFLSIANSCRNVTRLRLRGPAECDDALNISVKMAIRSLPALKVLKSEGIFPCLSMLDVVSVLESCPKIHTLSVGLVDTTNSSPITEDNSTSHLYGTFQELHELCFLPLTYRGHWREIEVSFPAPNNVILLSKLSLPNLASFSAWTNDEADTVALIKKCLVTWAPHLKKLTLLGGPSFDDIVPYFTQLVDLTCDQSIFSPSAILRMNTLQRFDMETYMLIFIDEILDGIDIEQSEPALPRLTHVKALVSDDDGSRSEQQTRLLSICQARNIAIEQPSDCESRTRFEIVDAFKLLSRSSVTS